MDHRLTPNHLARWLLRFARASLELIERGASRVALTPALRLAEAAQTDADCLAAEAELQRVGAELAQAAQLAGQRPEGSLTANLATVLAMMEKRN